MFQLKFLVSIENEKAENVVCERASLLAWCGSWAAIAAVESWVLF